MPCGPLPGGRRLRGLGWAWEKPNLPAHSAELTHVELSQVAPAGSALEGCAPVDDGGVDVVQGMRRSVCVCVCLAAAAHQGSSCSFLTKRWWFLVMVGECVRQAAEDLHGDPSRRWQSLH